MALKDEILKISLKAKSAAHDLALLSSETKNKALRDMACGLKKNSGSILSANRKDLLIAKKRGLSAAFLERLALNPKRIIEMAKSLESIARLTDPVGEIINMRKRPNGLVIGKMRVPIGVIGIIYESRPNVTSDCIGLCLKSSNSVILRGGSDAINSNLAIFRILNSIAAKNKIPEGSINIIPTAERKAVDILLKMDEYIDLIIPRGGEGLIREVVSKSRIPVIKHYKGVCHIYVDESADINMAANVSLNAKVQRPATCNAMETLLVNKKIAGKFLPVMINKFKKAGVEIRGCPLTRRIIPDIKIAKDKDFYTEYLDLILSVKVVKDINEAIRHIAKYGTMHSDSIITQNPKNAFKFLKEVDSAAVYVNASTRFTDGYQFGLGAEMGISTGKLHARGPMGLEELTTYKYIVFGEGQIRK
ncbi:MAG: glutamate-5-semialdehyde dehydrogenase [Candidatus Omnitrophica bacterium]|nr:glutamate-5-semialdehyde dehydrogenase [Candidatus Omnitrophota bacterium]